MRDIAVETQSSGTSVGDQDPAPPDSDPDNGTSDDETQDEPLLISLDHSSWVAVDGHLGTSSIVRYGPRGSPMYEIVSARDADKKGEPPDKRLAGRYSGRSKKDMKGILGVAWRSERLDPEELNPARMHKGDKRPVSYPKVWWTSGDKSWESFTDFAVSYGDRKKAAKAVYAAAVELLDRYKTWKVDGSKEFVREPTPVYAIDYIHSKILDDETASPEAPTREPTPTRAVFSRTRRAARKPLQDIQPNRRQRQPSTESFSVCKNSCNLGNSTRKFPMRVLPSCELALQ